MYNYNIKNDNKIIYDILESQGLTSRHNGFFVVGKRALLNDFLRDWQRADHKVAHKLQQQ